jgi:hypothetical protein
VCGTDLVSESCCVVMVVVDSQLAVYITSQHHEQRRNLLPPLLDQTGYFCNKYRAIHGVYSCDDVHPLTSLSSKRVVFDIVTRELTR